MKIQEINPANIACYDLDEKNKGLYMLYNTDPMIVDPLSGVVLGNIHLKKTNTIILDGFDDADAGIVDLPGGPLHYLTGIYPGGVKPLFKAMRQEGMMPIVIHPLDDTEQTADSISSMLQMTGNTALHVVLKNCRYGENGAAPENSFFDGDDAKTLNFPNRELLSLGGLMFDFPNLDDYGREAQKRGLRFRDAVGVFRKEGSKTASRITAGNLEITDGIWSRVLDQVSDAKPIFLFVSNKGGIGKSTMCQTCADFLRLSPRDE
jgi:hypothetical protein